MSSAQLQQRIRERLAELEGDYSSAAVEERAELCLRRQDLLDGVEAMQRHRVGRMPARTGKPHLYVRNGVWCGGLEVWTPNQWAVPAVLWLTARRKVTWNTR